MPPGVEKFPKKGRVVQRTPGRRPPRARVAGAGVRPEPKLWPELVARFGGRCAYCRERDDALTRDHIVPRSQGGPNHIANFLPACRPCNEARGATDIATWLNSWAAMGPLFPPTLERAKVAIATFGTSAPRKGSP